ncbi:MULTISPECIES: AbrB/MazE/SpoVT family DNA-binding domain-containing protein [unclassified Halomonas]|uniref:AbrB/MazE/SpoVT family DNA-binding domain-containing protein n=1 Tax=unclassified Halomonas TaxID=2609666 RepID=UPI0024693C50|nr:MULTISPECIES: AbrB/MazE/SpoVT family DNA-binding domain-containing protein [unclassified Halomonas]
MATATLSSKYQLAIPKEVREKLGLGAGQTFTVLAKGRVIELVPTQNILALRGTMKEADPADYRDHSDRV